MTGLRVYLADARLAGLGRTGVLCAPGVRAWCTHHGLSVKTLATEGYPIEVAENMNDAFAQRVAAQVRARHATTDTRK